MAQLLTDLEVGGSVSFEGVTVTLKAKSGRKARLAFSTEKPLQEETPPSNVSPAKPVFRKPAQ